MAAETFPPCQSERRHITRHEGAQASIGGGKGEGLLCSLRTQVKEECWGRKAGRGGEEGSFWRVRAA